MADEKPLALKRKAGTGCASSSSGSSCSVFCVVHFSTCKDSEVTLLSESQMQALQYAARRRQQQTNPDTRLDDICSALPTEFQPSIHGKPKYCFKKFTNGSRLHVPSEECDVSVTPNKVPRTHRRATQTAASMTTLLPQNSCIFCEKEFRYCTGRKEVLATCVTKCAESSIKEAVLAKHDHRLLGIVTDVDLTAKEARYHHSCRRDYIRRDDRSHKSVSSTNEAHRVSANRKAYNAAFECICQHIEEDILASGKVERMCMLRDRLLHFGSIITLNSIMIRIPHIP